jgi:hypothetical protein
MNCRHHNLFPGCFNELMCTACSPERGVGSISNNSNPPVKSGMFNFAMENYSPLSRFKSAGGEQVLPEVLVAYQLACRGN